MSSGRRPRVRATGTGAFGRTQAGQAGLDDGRVGARAFLWPPLRLARLRCERGSVDVVCPPVLPRRRPRRQRVRAVALDVHRDFCEVAIVEGGRLRSAGRIKARPEELEVFAQSLDARDRVALEVTGNAWAIAGILEA